LDLPPLPAPAQWQLHPIVANAASYPDYKGTLSVLLAKGDGTFQATRYAAGSEVGPVVVGDFNGDGFPAIFQPQ
jgi:hypothetical protein